MTERESFKAAFISRCIDEGVTDVGDMVQLAKRANDRMEKTAIIDAASRLFSGASKAISGLGAAAMPLLVAGPPIVGAGLGYLASRATDASDEDVDEIKRQEIIDELNRQALKLKRRSAMTRRRRSVVGGGRPMW